MIQIKPVRATAVPDQEVQDLALGVLGAGAQEGYRGQHVIAAAVVGEPPERAVEHDVPLDTNRRALMRDSAGKASGPLGVALDLVD